MKEGEGKEAATADTIAAAEGAAKYPGGGNSMVVEFFEMRADSVRKGSFSGLLLFLLLLILLILPRI